MAFPTYVAKGTFAHQATGSSLSVGLPSGWAIDDILIITLLHANPGSAVPTGWTRVSTEQDFGARSVSVFAKRAVSGETSASCTLTGGGSLGNSCAQMEAYRGCITTGDGFEAATGGTDSTVEVAFSSQSLTTLGLDRLVHVSAGQGGDVSGQRWSNWAGTNLANVTERVDDGFTDGTGGSIATAHGEKASAGSAGPFTADKDGSRADGNVVMALIPATPSSTFSADAVLFKTQTGSFNADAVLKREQAGSVTADAVLAVGASTVEGSLTADAVLFKTIAGSLTASAILFANLTGSLIADSISLKTQSGSFTANAVVVATTAGSVSADATLFKTLASSFAANAVLLREFGESLTADAELQTGLVMGSISADSIQLRVSSGSLIANAIELRTQTGSTPADGVIFRAITGAFSEDAVLLKSSSGSLSGNADLLRTQNGSLLADAYCVVAVSASFTADAFVQPYFRADAVLAAPHQFSADAVLVKPSRFYLSSSLTAAASPGFASGWESTGSALRRMMGNPSLASSTKTDLGVAETSTSGTFDVLNYQFVSEPLANASVICGPVGGYIRATESNSAADDRSQMVVKVVSGDGSTLIGTVIDFDASALTDEWPTTAASRRFPLAFTGSGTKGTPVSASAGDRVVVEVGYRAHNTSSTSRTGTLRSGHAVGGSDFTTSGTTTDLNPWIEISATTRLLPTDGSFTANAVLKKIRTGGIGADAYVKPPYVIQHARTGPHTGVDTELDHLIAWSFDRYLRGEPLRDVLIDIDARLTAREAGKRLHLQRLIGNAVLRVGRAGSFAADSYFKIVRTGSFLADALLQPAIFAKSFLINPAIYISDSIAGAVDWGISTTNKGAFISTASLTSEAGDPEDWWGDVTDKTGWAKFTLGSTQTVRISTDYTGGDSVIALFGPGSPTNGNFIDGVDDSDFNPAGGDSPYPNSESIEIQLSAGTYYVEVFPYDPNGPDFNIMLNMQIL